MGARKRRAAGDGSLNFDRARQLWVGRLARSLDPRRAAVYGRTQTEAREKLKRAARDAERGLVVLNENSRLEDYLEQWLDVLRSRVETGKLAATTAAAYERAVRRHLRPKIGAVPIRKLSPAHVEAMFGSLRGEGLSAGTIRRVRATLSRALSDAQRDELVARNVARLAEPPQLEKHNPSAFSVDEFRRIVQACESDRLGSLFLIAAHAGLRRSEALALRWRDVDLDRGSFQVREGLHQLSKAAERVTGRTGLVSSRPKTDPSSNALPLSSQAVEILRAHHRRQAGERLRCPQPWPADPDDTHVFASLLGTPLQPSNVSRAWRAVLRRAVVDERTPDGRPRGMHELRRTFATRLRDRGVPLEDVQRLGRWSSSKMLLEVYSASDGDRLRRAAAAVGQAMTE